jgi:hypothetical protein
MRYRDWNISSAGRLELGVAWLLELEALPVWVEHSSYAAPQVTGLTDGELSLKDLVD